MKSFRQHLTEGGERYPADDMTMKELKIAVNAAENVIDMLQNGAMIQRWQISAIVKASEELASVCTSMRADFDEKESDIAAYEYPWMGESAELTESHFSVGDKVECTKSGMTGTVIKLDKEHGADDEKYYTVKRTDGKTMKYAPKELKKIR